MRWFNNNVLWTQEVTFIMYGGGCCICQLYSLFCILQCTYIPFCYPASSVWVLFLARLVSIDALKIAYSSLRICMNGLSHTTASVCDIPSFHAVYFLRDSFISGSAAPQMSFMSHRFLFLINRSVQLNTFFQLLICVFNKGYVTWTVVSGWIVWRSRWEGCGLLIWSVGKKIRYSLSHEMCPGSKGDWW